MQSNCNSRRARSQSGPSFSFSNCKLLLLYAQKLYAALHKNRNNTKYNALLTLFGKTQAKGK